MTMIFLLFWYWIWGDNDIATISIKIRISFWLTGFTNFQFLYQSTSTPLQNNCVYCRKQLQLGAYGIWFGFRLPGMVYPHEWRTLYTDPFDMVLSFCKNSIINFVTNTLFHDCSGTENKYNWFLVPKIASINITGMKSRMNGWFYGLKKCVKTYINKLILFYYFW